MSVVLDCEPEYVLDHIIPPGDEIRERIYSLHRHHLLQPCELKYALRCRRGERFQFDLGEYDDNGLFIPQCRMNCDSDEPDSLVLIGWHEYSARRLSVTRGKNGLEWRMIVLTPGEMREYSLYLNCKH